MNTSHEPCESAIEDDPDASNRFVFYFTLPTLEEIAATRVALAIWYSYISSNSKSTQDQETRYNILSRTLAISDDCLEQCDKMTESLKTPTSIEEMLKSKIQSVIAETISWIRHFQYETFSDDLAHYFIQQFDVNWCVWSPDGKIDWARTALNMLSAPGITFVQKFAILSEFCMEEEIRKFPWRLLPESFIEELNFEDEYLMYYWICYLKNELHKIPAVEDFTSINTVMVAHCEDVYWEAFQYFWHRLGKDDQVSVLEFKYNDDSVDISNYQNRILSQMSWQQQRSLLSKVPHKIMTIFWFRLCSPDSTLWTWKHSKDLMTPAQFAEVLKEAFDDNVREEDDISLLLEIWRSASDQQKNYVVQTMEEQITKEFFCHADQFMVCFEFLYEFLSVKSADSRKETMFRNAGRFVANIEDIDSVKQIIQLCFPNDADLLEYKNFIMESNLIRRRFVELFHKLEFDNLIVKMKFCTTDEKKIQEFVEQLLDDEGITKWPFLTKLEDWNEFSEFLDEILPQDGASALNLKKQFITSYVQICPDRFDDERFEETIEILEMVFINEDELQTVKKYLLDNYQKFFFSNHYWLLFEEINFIRFVSWCLNGDGKAIVEFIKNIPVGDIFDVYFCRIANSYESTGVFYKSTLRYLDTCLRWYFKGDEGAKRYKLGRLEAFDELRIFQLILESREESTLDEILMWFFDDDAQAVRIFKLERLSSMMGFVLTKKIRK